MSSASLLSNLEKITATRDSVALEHSLLKAIGSTFHLTGLSLWTLDTRHEVVRALHYQRRIEMQAGTMERYVENLDTVYANIEVPPDVRNLAQSVLLTSRSASLRTPAGALHVFPLLGPQGLDGLVSMHVEQPLEDGERAVVEGILRVYANYQALLDDSQRDRLTGLYNRHAMDLNIDRMWSLLGSGAARPDARRKAAAHHHSLALIDIDHFKNVNDTYGHVLGDEILLLVSRLIASCFRKSDPVYRYGGEEFLVVAGTASPEAARVLFERVRSRVAGHVFPQVGKVTVSVGYTAVDPSLPPSENIGRADRALYVAKAEGRNQVQCFPELLARGVLQDVRYGSTELF